MSTKMSADLVVSRPTTRLHAPPGGVSSFSLGGDAAPTPAAPTPSAVMPPAPPATTAATAAVETVEEIVESVTSMSLTSASSNICVVVVGEDRSIVEALVSALSAAGISAPKVVLKVADPNLLPYVATKFSEGNIVVCLAVVASSQKASAMESVLLQAGVSSGLYILPAITTSTLAVEEQAQSWAASVATLQALQNGNMPPSFASEASPEVEQAAPAIAAPEPVIDVATATAAPDSVAAGGPAGPGPAMARLKRVGGGESSIVFG